MIYNKSFKYFMIKNGKERKSLKIENKDKRKDNFKNS